MAKKKSKRTPGKKVIRRSAVKKRGKKAGAGGGGSGGNAEMRRALELFDWSHQMTGKLAAGFGEHQMLFQPSPSDNHLMWQLGHMACTYSWFASLLDAKPATLGEMYDKLFGSGSKPMGDASMYPAHAEVRRIHDEQHGRLVKALSRMSDAQGLQPTPKESGGFVKSGLDLVYKCVWHEGWHQGQISSVRRALGLPGIMG